MPYDKRAGGDSSKKALAPSSGRPQTPLRLVKAMDLLRKVHTHVTTYTTAGATKPTHRRQGSRTPGFRPHVLSTKTDVRISGTKLRWQFLKYYVHVHGTAEQVPPALILGSPFDRHVIPFFPKAPDSGQFSSLQAKSSWVALTQSLCVQQNSTCFLGIILIFPQSSNGRPLFSAS